MLLIRQCDGAVLPAHLRKPQSASLPVLVIDGAACEPTEFAGYVVCSATLGERLLLYGGGYAISGAR